MSRSLLDMDMTTLARWLGEGWRWWLAELAGLVPVRLRRAAIGGLVAEVETDGTLRLTRGGRPVGARRGAVATVRLPATAVLVRAVALPALSAADARRWVEYQADRLLPFPPGAALVAVAIPRGAPAGEARVAALPVAAAAAALAAAAAADLRVRRLVAAGAEDGAAPDFLPAWRRLRGEPDPARARRAWWALVAAWFLLAPLSLVGADLLALRREERLVDAHAQAATMARLARRRVEAEQAFRQRLVLRRAAHDPAALLGELARRLPPGAVVRQLVVEDGTVRLTGVARGGDVAAALRAGPFAQVRATGVDALAATPYGQPFDVSFAWVGR